MVIASALASEPDFGAFSRARIPLSAPTRHGRMNLPAACENPGQLNWSGGTPKFGKVELKLNSLNFSTLY